MSITYIYVLNYYITNYYITFYKVTVVVVEVVVTESVEAVENIYFFKVYHHVNENVSPVIYNT